MIVRGVKNIFVEFLRRDGFAVEDAAAEYERVAGKTRDEYLTTVRLGATFRLNRAARRGVYETYLNALNHAGAEEFFNV